MLGLGIPLSKNQCYNLGISEVMQSFPWLL